MAEACPKFELFFIQIKRCTRTANIHAEKWALGADKRSTSKQRNKFEGQMQTLTNNGSDIVGNIMRRMCMRKV